MKTNHNFLNIIENFKFTIIKQKSSINHYLVSKIVVFFKERGDCKCESVKAGNLLILNRSCSHDNCSSARLIFLCTKDTLTESLD